MATVESEVSRELDLGIIRYSHVWEDHRVLARGLDVQPSDIIMCITSAGDNILNLLLECPKKIVAIDMSAAQNALLELKLAAIRCLSYEQYLQLLGEKPSSNREVIFTSAEQYLPDYAKEYWHYNIHTLNDGISFCGRLDRFFAKFATEHASSLISSDQIDELFSCHNLEEQRECINRWPVEKLGQRYLDFASIPNQIKYGRSAAQVKYVEDQNEVVCQQWSRIARMLYSLPVHDNFYFHWWIKPGQEYGTWNCTCPYLSRDGFEKLKSLVDRVVVHTGTVEEYTMLHSEEKFTKAGLSDVFEYMSKDHAAMLFERLSSVIRSGGRLAYWCAYVPRAPPEYLLRGKMKYLEQLSKSLHETDRTPFYSSFNVYQID